MTDATASATAKGRVLVVGATGFIGQFVTEASLNSGHPTYILVRPSSATANPSKTKIIKTFQAKGAIVLHGVINENELMEKLLKEHEIETVISAVGGEKILDQLSLIHAINAVGTIKRFLPSEFGHDVDRSNPVQPGLNMYKEKRLIRRSIEQLGLPYTYICCNSVASWPYHDNNHPSLALPPHDQIPIYGDGSVKAYFVAGADIGKFTMKTVDDLRTLDKLVHFRPSCNFYNMNELAALWEMKIERSIPRVTVTEDDLLSAAAENCIPQSVVASFTHDIFIKGCQVNFSIDGPHEVEVSSLYPEEPFISLDDCFNDFAAKLREEKGKETAPRPVVEPLPITATCA
ncbi:hypothetical protein SLEP1_g4393 [Rubroshorea leprosula]|uniref:NmrA-like domain-containing protein n=2 Tax=Rubroshorea leprosula TaxID=152421 RepID=A0AAV5HXF0_9ROSI|nr:hypothetical protein SLEP1_g4393 [Rubroshorea leprosula]